MSVRELKKKPRELAHFTQENYRWLELHHNDLPYGYSAIREHEDALELHVSLIRWGPQIRRNIHGDVHWLKEESRRLGKKRITGIRISHAEGLNPNLFRFARIYGFTDQCVLQTMSMDVDPA